MADDNVIRREFQAELVPVGDGRTIDVRIVPYNKPTLVRDRQGPAYEEEWLPGVFDKQMNAANRVFVNVEHEQGFSGVVGRGQEFREEPDGFLGSVRVLSGPDGDKALELVNDGTLSGVSLEAVPLKSQRTADGVVQRVKARLVNIALCRGYRSAFPDAQVLAVREHPELGVASATNATSYIVGTNGPEVFVPRTSGVIAPEPDEPKPEPPAPEPEPDSDRATEVLARIGYEELYFRNIVDRPFDDSAERFTDEEFQRSCLVDGKVPVLEPSGDLNVQAMREAEKRLHRTGLSTQDKAKAARKLMRYYRAARETPPPSLRSIASK